MNTVFADTRLALRNLRRNTSRTMVAVLSVAGGVIAFLLASGFITWIFHSMREGTIHSQLGHIQIVRPGYFEKGIADPYSYLLPAHPAELTAIENMAGVVSVTPRLAFSGLVSHKETTVAFSGEGVDPGRERLVSTGINIVEGADLGGANQREVLIGEGLAHALDVKPGDTIVLLVTAANGGASAIEVGVAGIFSTISKEYDDYAIRLPISQARKLMRVNGATSWVILLRETALTEGTVTRLHQMLVGRPFEVVPWTALADFYNKTVVLFSKQVNVVKLIIGLIIVLTISNTLIMSVLERTTEIGTSLAIGLRRNVIMRLFVIEGGLIGLIGGTIGVAMGYLLATVISAIGIPMPPPPGMAHGYIGQIMVTPDLAASAIVLAMVTTLLASLMPAWKAGRMNVVDALRYSQ